MASLVVLSEKAGSIPIVIRHHAGYLSTVFISDFGIIVAQSTKGINL